jgi:hypothetical protein
MITITHKGNFNKTEKFFKGMINSNYVSVLEKYAREGVKVLASATPIDSGKTANSWDFEINSTPKRTTITWTNSNIVNNVPIAIILQYGHATRNGGYVQGIDYINPVLRPIFDKIARDVWREVTEL